MILNSGTVEGAIRARRIRPDRASRFANLIQFIGVTSIMSTGGERRIYGRSRVCVPREAIRGVLHDFDAWCKLTIVAVPIPMSQHYIGPATWTYLASSVIIGDDDVDTDDIPPLLWSTRVTIPQAEALFPIERHLEFLTLWEQTIAEDAAAITHW